MKNKFLPRLLCLLVSAVMLLGVCSCAQDTVDSTNMPDSVNDNYRTFYQIFVGSFSDSNNDGIGDLRGIINRLDYLNDNNVYSDTALGVQGIWLSPIFSSPSYHKYDAADYYEVDWRFGTEADLKELVEKCHERNIKVILDLAINHTSSQHDWFVQFKEARASGDTSNPYYDYYSCVTTAEKQGGVTYQKIAGVDCWFECNFSGDMPELNYDNPEVRQAMLDVAQYYLDLGIDGFRFDAVKYIYFGDTARSVDFWEWYMAELRKINPEIYCVGECWSGENEILEYYSAMNCFNFAAAQAEGTVAAAAKGFSISKYTNYIESFQQKVLEKNPDGMVSLFLSNHDMDRIAGAFILENNMRMAANLYLLAPGSPVIYYGEEIGMRGSRGGEMTDANRRLAMLWGDGDLIRDPVGSTYPAKNQIQISVAEQMENEDSLYRYYCKLLTIRHSSPHIARGTYTAIDCGEKNFGGFRVDWAGETIFILHNTSTEEMTFDLTTCQEIAEYMSTQDGEPTYDTCEAIGMGTASLEKMNLTVGPQTSVILRWFWDIGMK